MMSEQKTFVWANPYHALDHRGWLAGAVPLDPRHGGGVRAHVGASFVVLSIERRGASIDDGRYDRQESCWRFFAEQDDKREVVLPLEVPVGPGRTYQQHIASGSLIKGSAEQPPLAELAKAREQAIADFTAAYGVPPPVAHWKKQYPLDGEIAAYAKQPKATAKKES